MNFRWKLFISSLLPLFSILLIQNISIKSLLNSFDRIKIILCSSKEMGAWSKFSSIYEYVLGPNTVFWIILLLGLLVSIKFSWNLYKLVISENDKKFSRKYEKEIFFNRIHQNVDQTESVDILNFIFTYLLPLLSLNINSYGSILSNILLIVFIGNIYDKNNNTAINIIFLLKNINVYKINSTYQVITDLTMIDIMENKNDTLSDEYNVLELTERIHVVKKIIR